VPNSKVDGFSEIYRNKEYADKDLSTTYDPEIKTLYDLFEYVIITAVTLSWVCASTNVPAR
jgi:hypothetical protein